MAKLTGRVRAMVFAFTIALYVAQSLLCPIVFGQDYVRSSLYITVRDGTRLAADFFWPAQGKDKQLPVIWAHYRYHRADLRSGRLTTILDGSRWLRTLLEQGYIVAVVDARGTGSSYGTRTGEFTRDDARDAYDITEWLATQPWCDGSVGMFGRSYMGITQYMAASMAPPHLKAIYPEMAMFDLYDTVYPGGIMRNGFIFGWGGLVGRLDAASAAPVDGDANLTILNEAMKGHAANLNVFQRAPALPYRDSKDPDLKIVNAPYAEWSPCTYRKEICESGVAVCIMSGWYDLWPRDALTWFNNLDNPRRIIIGPWAHTYSSGIDLAQEHLRWYDYWLKGIDNGVMKEAPIVYYTLGAQPGKEWRTARQWPLPNEKRVKFHMAGGPSGSVTSVNDGLLRPEPPAKGAAPDVYTVNYSCTSGLTTRWANGYGAQFFYGNMTPNDIKGLTYTTAPLTTEAEVTGHPEVHLWVSSSAKDGDFFVYLEEVDAKGFSTYITEGLLRASHRAVATSPRTKLALPYHPSTAAGAADLPADAPVELVFDLQPTSNIFDKGNRIRITVTCADRENAWTPQLSPAPVVKLHRDADHASYVILPFIGGKP